ncbi:MAG: hypothetical protein GX115_01900 [Ruminiclostridium sp.]|nr:hypothetical protein [Ruminiclostridium sp.]
MKKLSDMNQFKKWLIEELDDTSTNILFSALTPRIKTTSIISSDDKKSFLKARVQKDRFINLLRRVSLKSSKTGFYKEIENIERPVFRDKVSDYVKEFGILDVSLSTLEVKVNDRFYCEIILDYIQDNNQQFIQLVQNAILQWEAEREPDEEDMEEGIEEAALEDEKMDGSTVTAKVKAKSPNDTRLIPDEERICKDETEQAAAADIPDNADNDTDEIANAMMMLKKYIKDINSIPDEKLTRTMELFLDMVHIIDENLEERKTNKAFRDRLGTLLEKLQPSNFEPVLKYLRIEPWNTVNLNINSKLTEEELLSLEENLHRLETILNEAKENYQILMGGPDITATQRLLDVKSQIADIAYSTFKEGQAVLEVTNSNEVKSEQQAQNIVELAKDNELDEQSTPTDLPEEEQNTKTIGLSEPEPELNEPVTEPKETVAEAGQEVVNDNNEEQPNESENCVNTENTDGETDNISDQPLAEPAGKTRSKKESTRNIAQLPSEQNTQTREATKPHSPQEELSEEKTSFYEERAARYLTQNKVNYLYWLSREAEGKEDKESSIFPSWLALGISVIFSAESFDLDEKQLIAEMVENHKQVLETIENSLKCEHEYAALLEATLALRAVLLAPETSALQWLAESMDHLGSFSDKFYGIFSEIYKFAQSGATFSSASLYKELGKPEWREVASELSKKVIRFVDENRIRKFNYAPANFFFNRIFEDGGDIAVAYDAVVNGKYEQSDCVNELINKLLSDEKSIKSYISETITRMMEDEYNMKRVKIQGNALDMVARRIDELRSLFERWVTIVSEGKASEINSERNWNIDRTKELHMLLRAEWEKTEKNLKLNKAAKTMEKAIYTFSVNGLDILIKNFFTPVLHGEQWFSNIPDENMVPLWKKILGYPLLFVDYPGMDEDGNFEPSSADYDSKDFIKAFSSDCDLWKMFERHLNNNDFNAAGLCRGYLMAQGENVDTLSKRYAEREHEAKANIRTVISQLEQRIIQASIDHIISENENSSLLGKLLSVEKESMEDNRVSGNLYKCLKDLDDIRKELQGIKTLREESLGKNIANLAAEVQKKAESLAPNAIEFINKYISLGNESLKKGELGVADEFIHFAENAFYQGELKEYTPREGHENYVREFCMVSNDLEKFLKESRQPIDQIFRTIDTGSNGTKISKILKNLSNVPGGRRFEVKEGLEAWSDIKEKTKGALNKNIQHKFEKLFSYLGFNVTPWSTEYGKYTNTYASFSIKMAVGNLSPLSDFGSSCNGKYHVIVFPGRPNSMTMVQTVIELGLQNNSPIIIFLGRMTPKQREEWADACKTERLTAMLIDELLVYYVAGIRENRLPAVISCGAAWSNVMPYRSFGIIPKEIFKGRKDMIQSLGRPEGSCIVYGGRQFGKSVLLHMVEQEFNKPERNEFVIYDDIKQIGDPSGIRQVSEIWKLMYNRMVTTGFLQKDPKIHNDADGISELIIGKLLKETDSRIIVLFDEADNFMEADAQNNFNEISRLRRIMDSTQRRFKVVFCGLHSVFRHISYPNDPLRQRDKNHPFAQLMALPLNVGPLDPSSAQELIIDPMTAIGFDFTSEESLKAVYKILSYTNYHPALIQHFCSEMIREIRRSKKKIPYSITVTNVEAVYRKPEIRNFIKERFNWTLALDTRYAVIVYSMVVSQINDHDGYRKEYSPKEIYDMVTDYWAEGFENMGTEDIDSILRELEGLGVIIKLATSGTYRLRNANVVRALGTDEEISERLMQYVSKPAPAGFIDTERIRIKLSDGKPSALTVRQIGDLIRRTKSGISLVFGSEALGIGSLPKVFQNIEEHDKDMFFENITAKLNNFDKTVSQIETRYKNKRGIGKQLVFYGYIQNKKQNIDILKLITSLNELIAGLPEWNSILRIILVFDSVATWKWMLEKNEKDWEGKEPEYLSDSVIVLKKWDPRALNKFLNDIDVVCDENTAKDIIKLTGGWPMLIDRLLDEIDASRLTMQPEPLVEARQVNDQLKMSDSDLLIEFLKALGFKDIDGCSEIYDFAGLYEAVSMKDVIDECIPKGIDEKSIKASVKTMALLKLLREDEPGKYDGNLAIEGIPV